MVLVWQPITDLPEDWSSLTDQELKPLLQFWNDQRGELEQSGALAVFSQRLAREWAIETGQIEGVYNLDRGITQTLIARGISADLIPAQPGQKPPELIAAIIQDHADVLEGLLQFVKGERPLSKSYIHEVHAALMKHQQTTVARDQFGHFFESKLLKGKYKERPNNPQRPDGTIYEFCPPEQVDPEMERLLAMHAEHEKRGVPVEVEAAWLHHRFTQIHPYQDGNGRVARALASLLFVKAGWFPVVVTRDDRPRYLDALEIADEGALPFFVWLLVALQKRELFRATQTAADVQPAGSVEEAVKAIKHAVRANKPLAPGTWSKAKDITDRLMSLVEKRFEELAAALRNEIGKEKSNLRFHIGDTANPEIQKLPLPYLPNKGAYQRIQALSIDREWNTNQRSMTMELDRIVVHAHTIGSEFRGLIGVVAIFDDLSNPTLASKEPFQVNYAEPYEAAERRFRPWLEESLVNALTLWRKTL
jgi:fido (protein-threonine AMPylation protein)